MKITSLNVLGLKVPVKYKELDNNYRGLYTFEDKAITIDTNQSPQQMLETIIHELGHAIFDRAGIRQAHISQDAQEIIVENFSTVLLENFNLRLKK